MPPSSIETRNSPSADWATSRRPTSVDPVKVSLRSRGSPMIGSITAPVCAVVMTLSTPGGSPHSCNTWASSSMVSGVC